MTVNFLNKTQLRAPKCTFLLFSVTCHQKERFLGEWEGWGVCVCWGGGGGVGWIVIAQKQYIEHPLLETTFGNSRNPNCQSKGKKVCSETERNLYLGSLI